MLCGYDLFPNNAPNTRPIPAAIAPNLPALFHFTFLYALVNASGASFLKAFVLSSQ